jgi:hypothetical protein
MADRDLPAATEPPPSSSASETVLSRISSSFCFSSSPVEAV